MKKTPWFSCRSEKPVRDGMYEVRLWQAAYGGREAAYSGVNQYEFRKGKWIWKIAYWDGPESRPGWHKLDQWRGVLK